MNYEHLLKPGKIGNLYLKNRVVMPAIGVNLANGNGEATEVISRYYEERAKGGVGLIITEITRIDDEYGVGTLNQLSVTKARHIPHLERMISASQKHGAKVFIQLHHPGRQTKASLIEGRQIVGPSAIMCKVTDEMPRALTTEECEALVKNFIKGALISKTAGADGVELHAAHGYLLNQFISPYTNVRSDKYGGNFNNRMRIMAEIITGIKDSCGKDFPISVRISADEFVEGGLELEDSIKVAKSLESYGVDAINVSSGIYESATTIIEPASYPQAWKKHLAQAIRKNIEIPVIAVNNIKDPETAEELLENGICDFIGIGRALLADPYFVRKAQIGKSNQVRKCIGCLNCFAELSAGRYIKCAVNGSTGREFEFVNLEKDGENKIATVIGGGPAGMQAALILDEKGYDVVLFEEKDSLGGTLKVAYQAPRKEKVKAFNDGLIAEIESSGVDVRLNTKATVEMIRDLEPAAVFLAVGATPTLPSIPGIDKKHVMKAEDVLFKKVYPKGKVAIIGSGLTGLETAEVLAEEGHKVIVIEMLKEIGPDINRTILVDLMMRFKQYEPELIAGHKLMAIEEQGVLVMNQETSQTSFIEADTVVLALGVTPRKELVDEFRKAFPNAHVIGDANSAGSIQEAIRDGFQESFVFTRME